jgi:aconitate hydratase
VVQKAFANVEIPAGNGIMHQINLEKMSPVVQPGRRGLPDTCVGTDSHTPHVDALGVIAIGVGGLEAENVMLGRAIWMRLPEIVGVELPASRQRHHRHRHRAGADRVPAQRKGGGRYWSSLAKARAACPSATAPPSPTCPEYGATAACSIDEQTLDYLRLTGRSPSRCSWSRPTPRPRACGPTR